MARVLPFRALRFASLDAISRRAIDDISAVRDQGRRPHVDDPLHVLRLYASPDPWASLTRWEAAGHLVSEEPALYVIESRLRHPLPSRPPVRFLLGAMDAEVPELEQVREREAEVPLEPVPVLAADDRNRLREVLAEVAEGHPAAWEPVVGTERIRLWRVEDGPLARRIRAAIEGVRLRPHGRIPARGSFLAAVVPLLEPGLRVLPYHRGLRDLATFSPDRFLALVSDFARVSDLDAPLTDAQGLESARAQLATVAAQHRAFLFVLPRGVGKLLRFRQGLELSHIAAAPRSPTLRSLDLALLNALALRTVLGIRDPEVPDHPQVFPVASLDELVARVNQGVFQAGFALNPPPIWELRAVMEAAQALPPRTMRVWPTPPVGLLFLDPRARG